MENLVQQETGNHFIRSEKVLEKSRTFLYNLFDYYINDHGDTYAQRSGFDHRC